MRLLRQPPLLTAIWLLLLAESAVALFRGEYVVAFAGVGTFGLTLLPIYSQRLFQVEIPTGFLAAIALFLIATLFLGEVGDFYERFWWWDVVLHIGSAIGFGLIGVVLMLILVRGDKLSAAPITVSFFAFCFAVMIGTVWEIWEFFLDQTFGLNTQKSGLPDTMWDLIVDCLGAAVGALVGFVYLKGKKGFVLTRMLRDFVEKNGRLFGRRSARAEPGRPHDRRSAPIAGASRPRVGARYVVAASKEPAMMNWMEYRNQILGRISEVGRLSPDTLKGYQSLAAAGTKTGCLDAKTRELIALAVAVSVQCDGCIAVHSKAAVEHGASQEEIAEALGVAVAVNAGAALVFSGRVLDAVESFRS